MVLNSHESDSTHLAESFMQRVQEGIVMRRHLLSVDLIGPSTCHFDHNRVVCCEWAQELDNMLRSFKSLPLIKQEHQFLTPLLCEPQKVISGVYGGVTTVQLDDLVSIPA